MTDTAITCPHCGNAFELSDALATQLHARLDADHQARLDAAVREAAARAETDAAAKLDALNQLLDAQRKQARDAEAQALALKQQALDADARTRQQIDAARLDTETRLRAEQQTLLGAKLLETEARLKSESAVATQSLQAQLQTERAQREAAQQAELALRQQADALEARARDIELEIARSVDARKTEWEKGLRQSVSEEQSLKIREKEKQIEDLGKVINELQRKSQQGSQEMQGEVLELDIQAALERQFPHDRIAPVPKGMTGADLIQTVVDAAFNPCGALIWEVKNTKSWSPAWLDKLKADQREAGAALAVIVSVALPEGVRGFAQIQGVWVSDLVHYPMLAVALRDQLQQLAYARAAGVGKNDKMERLYQYLAGNEFRHKVETIVEAFTAMRVQLDKERRAMNKHWAEREKQIERVVTSTTGMYGALQGIIGQSLPAIAALEFDDDTPLLTGDE
jgi:Uncharacterized protein conserved in bacteria